MWNTREIKRLQYLLAWGLSQKQIGERMGRSQQVISYQVSKLRKEFLEFEG